ncbi:hypothetical protein MKQ70_14970 [Chitinophaga sedimenti]|uniref:hypothetical protein n=1 Tax=Chitinophaga sedimenti TaxID=2033606 RepID=UPI002005613E|nr:hypothetical protein [Chitinophaga sedimenti]MCK7556246.1 hypothetical protein [Chitinophaga sedimenti]
MSGALASAWAFRHEVLVEPAKVAMPEMMVYSRDQQEAVDNLLEVFDQLSKQPTYAFSGQVNVVDPSDSTANMSVPFRYAKHGDSVYYQLGESRMLTLPGISVSVDDGVRKIFVAGGAPRQSGGNPFTMPKDTLLRLFSMEGYEVSSIIKNGITTVKLARENHATCKEYRLAYDTQMRIREIYTRFTDFSDPLNKEKDKITQVTVFAWEEGHAPSALLNSERFVRQSEQELLPGAGLEGYEIVIQ